MEAFTKNRREKDMKLTLKENININSLTLQHNIILQATTLIQGREGVLETEKRIYLLLALVDMIVQEDFLELCNSDERILTDILMEDVEPFIDSLKNENKDYIYAINYMEEVFLEHCQQIWDNQHSIIGAIEAFLMMIGSMSEEDKKEALIETSKIAQQAFDSRTKTLEKETKEVNSKLEQLVQQYQRQSTDNSKGDDTK